MMQYDVLKVIVTDFWIQKHFLLVTNVQCNSSALTDSDNPLGVMRLYLLRNEYCKIFAMQHIIIIYLAEIGAFDFGNDLGPHEVVLLIKSRILD